MSDDGPGTTPASVTSVTSDAGGGGRDSANDDASPESSSRRGTGLADEMPFAASAGASSGWADELERSASPDPHETRSPRDSHGSQGSSHRPRRSDSFNLTRSIPIPEDEDMPTGFGADVIIPGPELDSVSMPLSVGANETIDARHVRARSEERASPTHVPPAHQSMRIERGSSLISDRRSSRDDHRTDVTGGPKSTGYAGATKATRAKSDGKDSLRKLFKLPDDEVLIEEYLCALYKKILLQGRMYLFRNYVCFYSNVFGYQKNKVIPLKDVTIVRRAYTVKVVPNAIEIVCNGKCEFFTSFIFPDRAYRNITNAWKECSQYAKIFAAADVDNGKAAAEMLVAPKLSSPPSAEVAAMLGLPNGGDDVNGDVNDVGSKGSGPRSSGSEGRVGRRRGKDKDGEEEAASTSRHLGGDAPASRNGSGPNSAGSQSASAMAPRHPGDKWGERSSDGSPAASLGPESSSGPASVHSESLSTGGTRRRGSGSVSGVRRSVTSPAGMGLDMAPGESADAYESGPGVGHVSDEDDEEEEEEDGSGPNSAGDVTNEDDFGERLIATSTPVPPRPSDMRTLEECVLECAVQDVFQLVWSDSAAGAFGAEDHASRGETAVQTTKWSRHRHHGHARDLAFIAPVNASIGPKQTNCHQTQSYHACRGGVLVVDTSQVQTDIPYGDYFRVETRWEIAPAPPYRRRVDGVVVNRCTVWIGLRIPFHRSTMLRKVIEQSVSDECKKSAAGTVQLLADALRRQDEAARSRAAAVEAPSPREALDRLTSLGRGSGGGGGKEGGDVVDVSKLNIPDDSFDIISRMLFGSRPKQRPPDDASGSSPGRLTAASHAKNAGGGVGLTVALARGSGDSSSAGFRSTLTSPSGPLTPSGMSDRGPSSPKRILRGWRGVARSWLAAVPGAELGGPGHALVAMGLLLGALAVAWSLVGLAWRVSTGGYVSLGPGGGLNDGNDVEYWRRRAAQLEKELQALERRVAFVAGEVSHANRALAEAASQLK